MKNITNNSNVPLGMAAYLAFDEYDFKPSDKAISTTSIIKSVRQIILTRRVASENDTSEDVLDRVNSRVGHAVHDAIERVWLDPEKRTKALQALGWSASRIERVLVNPKEDELFDGCIPIYMEQRGEYTINGWSISGKFDRVDDGQLSDYKTTSTYTYTNQSNRDKYILQGSIYKVIHNKIINGPELTIQYWFKDWSKAKAHIDSKYPASPVLAQKLPLMTEEETVEYLDYKTRQLNHFESKPESELPKCTDNDLWRDAPKFKYYSNPDNLSRATKNFDNLIAANTHMHQQGKGIVLVEQGKVRACNYCLGRYTCSQYKEYINAGLID